jgi:hypothetical protein
MNQANSSHLLKFYDDHEDLVDMLENIVTTGLESREPSLIIATNEHRNVLRRRLTSRGIDVDSVIRDRRFLDVDAHATLERIMRNGSPDPKILEAVVKNEMLGSFGETTRTITAFGEMVGLLCDNGCPQAAVTLEEHWNEMLPPSGLNVVCAYPSSVCFGHSQEIVDQIHAAHTGLIGDDPRARRLAGDNGVTPANPLKMLFSLPLPSGDEDGIVYRTMDSIDKIIPVLYRLEVITTATYDGVGYSYELTGELAEKRNSGLIKDTFHNSPTDPYAPWGTSMKIDAVILYDSESGGDR